MVNRTITGWKSWRLTAGSRKWCGFGNELVGSGG